MGFESCIDLVQCRLKAGPDVVFRYVLRRFGKHDDRNRRGQTGSHHANLFQQRIARQPGFDRHRRDVFSFCRFENVLDPTSDPVGLHGLVPFSAVARTEEAVFGHHLARQIRLLEILGKQAGTAQQYLAFL